MKNILLACLCTMTLMISVAQTPKVISRLEIIDVKSEKRVVVKQFEEKIEAPNWTPDGKYLVYNCNGLMYKIAVAGGESILINTGKVINCNNDHVLSADGKLLAVSAKYPSELSQAYVLPFTGGEPKMVTINTPSYPARVFARQQTACLLWG